MSTWAGVSVSAQSEELARTWSVMWDLSGIGARRSGTCGLGRTSGTAICYPKLRPNLVAAPEPVNKNETLGAGN